MAVDRYGRSLGRTCARLADASRLLSLKDQDTVTLSGRIDVEMLTCYDTDQLPESTSRLLGTPLGTPANTGVSQRESGRVEKRTCPPQRYPRFCRGKLLPRRQDASHWGRPSDEIVAHRHLMIVTS